ncbi:helix-turn-helix transcriptional regulator [Paraconexibacter antarcticus]|uniref:Helix-turn-helix transcriptional regulator n=1 Tax=Paraconexibacter antarcticus TaxID=2949664 RepID=A0ABY5DVL0_9ACTN|nr:helix-turn-helix transcriptional regulator [Paraconexibacter antarcticus]UTI66048.1 helix-turn-helix transcriptional regulator [Paraconexibacter antarcticus]
MDELTRREREVMRLIARGQSNQAIALQLYLSVRTVESHIASIFMKFGLADDDATNRRVVAAVLWARTVDEELGDEAVA